MAKVLNMIIRKWMEGHILIHAFDFNRSDRICTSSNANINDVNQKFKERVCYLRIMAAILSGDCALGMFSDDMKRD